MNVDATTRSRKFASRSAEGMKCVVEELNGLFARSAPELEAKAADGRLPHVANVLAKVVRDFGEPPVDITLKEGDELVVYGRTERLSVLAAQPDG